MYLNLYLRGLFIYVPKWNGGNTSAKSMRVLMVDARAPQPPFVPHVPNVRFLHTNFDIANSDKPDHKRKVPDGAGGFVDEYIWFLNKDDLKIKVNGKVLSGNITVRRSDDVENMALKDFSYIPEMANLYPEDDRDRKKGRKVDPIFTGSAFPASKVIARLTLNGGELSAYASASGTECEMSTEKFVFVKPGNRPPTGQTPQFVAGCVLYRKEIIASDKVKIESSNKEFTLIPRGGDINLTIKNMPLDGVTSTRDKGEFDVDFGLVYEVTMPRNDGLNEKRLPIEKRLYPLQGKAGVKSKGKSKKLQQAAAFFSAPQPVICGAAVYNEE